MTRAVFISLLLLQTMFGTGAAAQSSDNIPIDTESTPKQGVVKSIDLNNMPVGRALEELAKRAGVKLMMDKPVGNEPISITLSNVTPKEALEALLQKAKLRYEFVSDDIVIVTDAPPINNEPLKATIQAMNTVSAPSDTPSTSVPPKKMLFGKIEHSQALSPLAPAFRAGAQFDVTKFRALTPNNYWYKIPAWSSGTWHTETTTTVHLHKFKPEDSYASVLASLGLGPHERMDDWEADTHMARNNETWGFQQDRDGDVWEFAYNNYYTLTEGERTYTVSFVKDVQVLSVTNSEVVLKYTATSLLVGKYTRRIGVAIQKESIQTYSSAGGNMRRCEGSIKVFDEDGKPDSLAQTISIQLRTKAFHQWDVLDGRDMRVLFAEYLTTHGMEDLVPVTKYQPLKKSH